MTRVGTWLSHGRSLRMFKKQAREGVRGLWRPGSRAWREDAVSDRELTWDLGECQARHEQQGQTLGAHGCHLLRLARLKEAGALAPRYWAMRVRAALSSLSSL